MMSLTLIVGNSKMEDNNSTCLESIVRSISALLTMYSISSLVTNRPCKAKEEPISYVVKALGKSDTISHNTIRVSLSYENTLEDVKKFIKELENILKEIK